MNALALRSGLGLAAGAAQPSRPRRRLRNRWGSLVACATSAAFLSVVAAEATAQAGSVVLTVEDALERAVEHNPQYQQALNRIQLAGPQARQAWGAFLPSLSLSYNTGQSYSRRSTAFDNFDNPIERQNVRTIGNSSASQSVSLALDLFRGGSRFYQIGQARAQARVTRRAGERELNRVLAEVRRHFLAAQRHQARLAVERQLLAERERDAELTHSRFDLAAIGRSDMLAAELDLETQRTAVEQARATFDKSLLSLKSAIGDPLLAELDVDGTAPTPFDPAELDVDGIVAHAMEASPRAAETRATLAVQQASLKSSRAARWPTFSISGSFSRSSYAAETAALFDISPADMTGGVSFSLSVPVFRRFETSFAIAQAAVEVKNAMETIRLTELEIEREIRGHVVDLESAWRTATERARRLEIADQRLAIVREEYELAAKSVEELRTAIRERASALRDAVDQSYEFATVLVALYEAAGLSGRPGEASFAGLPN